MAIRIICKSVDKVNETIKQHSLVGCYSYVSYKRDKGYGNSEEDAVKEAKTKLSVGHRLLWCGPNMPFDGHAYIPIAEKILLCHQGKDLNLNKKAKYAKKKNMAEEPEPKKRKMNRPISKKCNCPARIVIKQVVRFTDCWVGKNEQLLKQNAKHNLQSMPIEEVNCEMIYFVYLPEDSSHQNHPMGTEAGTTEPIDYRVRQEIQHLVQRGVYKVIEIQPHIQSFVENILFKDTTPPEISRRRFYPKKTDIENIVYAEKVRHKRFQDSQSECLDNSVNVANSDSLENKDVKIMQVIECMIESGTKSLEPTESENVFRISSTPLLLQNESSNYAYTDTQLGQLATKCLNKFKNLENLTYRYLMQNPTCLEMINSRLDQISQDISQYVPVLDTDNENDKKQFS